ncbi:MAG: tyrosine-type recombinase/integrase [Candidatus Woesearchaeota archaeon]|jgi:site-specific recombinase XerD|nr:tyrosine-type recombinase/integrase [Candidatus Woesearchaeota archaeon]MDP7506360.1 tyrosine-type recombinase/integrase [Candidatus Woesearchaeota archaeon]|tara:strand:- start:809 stop:1639 length:831 start_codon:yes stop_codon:yes gene_type:complete
MDIPELIRKTALRRGLSPRTIKTYRECVKRFFRACDKNPKNVNKKDIQDFLDRLIEKDAPGNTINVYLNALKFFYNEILNKRLMIRIRFSKTPRKIAEFMTREETIRLIEAIENPAHQLMVKLMYSAGLRVSELVNLKPKNFEFDNNYGWVRNGKGSKDRLFIIAKFLKQELTEHIEKECSYPDSWLFKGRKGHISVRSIQKIVEKANKKAHINKNIHPHTLRHTFATHLISNKYDITSVQSLLGHSRIETTFDYVHIASPRMIYVSSPFDSLYKK